MCKVIQFPLYYEEEEIVITAETSIAERKLNELLEQDLNKRDMTLVKTNFYDAGVGQYFLQAFYKSGEIITIIEYNMLGDEVKKQQMIFYKSELEEILN